MVNKIEDFLKRVDKINDWIGRATSYLLLGLCFVVLYEVVMRYFLQRPSTWSWEVATQLFSMIVLLGGGYTTLQKAHVVIDVFIERLSPKRRALLDLLTSPVIYFSLFVFMVWGGRAAWSSLLINEVTSGTVPFPLYTIKWMLVIGAFLIFLQMLVKSIRDIIIVTQKGA